jgi:hypothetical protein
MFAFDVAPAFEGEVLCNSAMIKSAVRIVLAGQNPAGNFGDFSFNIQKIGVDRFQVATNLGRVYGLEPEEEHETIRRALLGIAGMYQRLGEMKAHDAIAGFTDEELPLFRDKFKGLADLLGANRSESRFLRVLSVSGLGDDISNRDIDVGKISKLRTSPEAKEFRGWLSDVDKLSDSEIKDRVASLNAKLGVTVQTTAGKAIRLLVTSLAGLYPLLGLTLGVLDHFIWDRFFRRSGVAAFINELYPSIFAERNPR